jgi:hypothetical protein
MHLNISPVHDPSDLTPVARYARVQEAAKSLLDPIRALMVRGKAEVAIDDSRPGLIGPVGGELCTRFELCGRPMLLAAHWLHSLDHLPQPQHEAVRQETSAWFRNALVLGTDPQSPSYWGADANYYQLHVDMGLLPIAFHLARGDLWDPLTPAQKAQIATWLGTSRGAAYVHNNHYFMGVHILEFLHHEGFGERRDRPLIDTFFARMETMYRGDGWFEDGANQSFDYYNAYAFHYYGLWWARLYGHQDPARAERWRQWTRLFLHDYEHFFSASGENVPFGRSLPYRFNAIAVFGVAALEGVCDLPIGRIRRLSLRNLDFFLQRPIFQHQGCIALGWTDHFDPAGENYLKPGSSYWAAKGLALLLLPPCHPFWTEPEVPMLSEGADYTRLIPAAGLVVRNIRGTVEILNGGAQISDSRAFMGVWRWSKTSYRSGVGFSLPQGTGLDWSIDSALTQTVDDGRLFGRHATYAITQDSHHLHFTWNMGDRVGPVSTGVESLIYWNAGWLLQLHRCDLHQPARLKLGGFALPSNQPAGITETAPSAALLEAWSSDGRGTVLQSLFGFSTLAWDRRTDETTPRSHLVAPYHSTPWAETERHHRRIVLVALTWSGSSRLESAPWRIESAGTGHWILDHPLLGGWEIRDEALPGI